MARNTKYSQELAQTIYDAIALGGGDESGWVAGNIGQTTFYKWFKDNREFRELIGRARKAAQKNAPARVKKLATDRVTEALENGQTIRWTTKKTRKIEHFAPAKEKGESDKLVWYQVESTEEEHIEERPTPQWAIDRVLPKPIENVNDAIALIERYGLKVVIGDAELFERYNILAQNTEEGAEGNGSRGISPETANDIRARILGISPDASGVAALPGEMEQRSQSGEGN